MRSEGADGRGTVGGVGGPVLGALGEGRMGGRRPVRGKLPREDRAQYTYLEAFGRTMTGLAPWLELEGLTGSVREGLVLVAGRRGVVNSRAA